MGGFNIVDIIMDPNRFSRQRSSNSKSSSSVSINQLPPEIIAQIFTHLQGRDLASAARVCKTFNQACDVDKIWQIRCQKEFKVACIASGLGRPHTQSFYKELFRRVMHKYGALVGDWQPEITHYGGLVEIKFENGGLVGIEWLATDDAQSLRRSDLFSISLNEDGECETMCLRGYQGPHKCQIILKEDGCFNLKCCQPETHRHPQGNDAEFDDFSSRGGVPLNHDLLLMKYLHIQKYENSFDFSRLPTPGTPSLDPIIQPGLFQGIYGFHGQEIISLTYEQDGAVAKFIKITGDPNVPYRQVTFRVDLRCSMVLNEDQQRTIQNLMLLRRNSTNVLPKNLPVQPFLVPTDCFEYGELRDLPNQCKARFAGYAQIAGYGFTNSSYSPGHWIVFDDGKFAFIFLELASISLYQRCQRNYTVPELKAES